MEVKYRSVNGQFEVVFDVKGQDELFEEIANFQEVFESGEVVIRNKLVPASDIQFRVRVVNDDKYYEKVYVGPDKELWGYKLPYGKNKRGGGLFPKWKIEEDDKPNYDDGGNGWRKWRGGTKQQPQQQQTTQKQSKQADDERPF